MVNNNIGQILLTRRKEKGLTLIELGEKTGVHQSTIQRIETGSRNPTAEVLIKLAEPLGYDEIELLKMAGILEPDATDDRLAKLKASIKGEIETTMSKLAQQVDRL